MDLVDRRESSRNVTLQRGICVAEIRSIMLDQRRSTQSLPAEGAGVRTDRTLSLRSTTDAVSYPRLRTLSNAGEMGLNSMERGRIESWQVLSKEAFDRGKIEPG